jgi:hypothetical protein
MQAKGIITLCMCVFLLSLDLVPFQGASPPVVGSPGLNIDLFAEAPAQS